MVNFNNIKVFFNINNSSKKNLLKYSKIKKYKKGEHLFLDRDRVDNIYFVLDGIASLYKLNSSHDKKVIFIYGKGEILNEVILQKNMSSLNCEILSDCEILEIPAKKFLEVMSYDFQLSRNIIESMAYKIRRLYHQLKNTSNSIRLDKQIASKLWKLSRDFGKETDEGIEINFNLSISYLADMLGSKRETVSRQLKILSEKDLIIVKRNRFVVVNRDNLLKYFRNSWALSQLYFLALDIIK